MTHNTDRAAPEPGRPATTRALAAALAVVVVAVPALVAAPAGGLAAGPAAGGTGAPAAPAAAGSPDAPTALTTQEAACTLSSTAIETGESVTIQVDPNEDVDAVQYDETGDGSFGDLTEVFERTFTYEEAGTYTPQVRAWTLPEENTTTEVCGELTVSAPFDVELSYSPASPETGQTVDFAADVAGNPEGSVQYAWDFAGDGELERTTAEPTVEHAYDEQGEYPVTVRVTDEAGQTATAERVVVVEGEPVTPEPTATPTPPPSPAEGEVTAGWWYTPIEPRTDEVVTLVASSGETEGVTYNWDLDGDGSAEASGQVVSHTFAEPGDREVTLRVSGGGPEDLTHRKVLPVEPNPGTGDEVEGPTFWYTPLDPRAGEMVVLVASPENPDAVDEYAWDLDGDGSVDQRGPVVDYTFQKNGSTAVTLEIERQDGTVERVENDVAVELSANETIRDGTVEGDGGPTDRGEEVPGVGPASAVAAVVAAAVLLARGRRSEG